MSNKHQNARQINDALHFDPLAEAERVTGSLYKGSMETIELGVMLMQTHGVKKKQMLEANDDTTLSNKLDRYLRIVGEEGFREILKVPFTSPSSQKKECLYVMYHDSDGILLVFDTYGGDHVNGGKFYYNIRLEPKASGHRVTSSGSYRQVGDGYVWVGDHDCREALRHHITQLRAHGEFVKEWVEQPFLWILHHGDTTFEDYDYEMINSERIAMLPIEVQRSISGKH